MGFLNVSHAMLTALSARWHEESSSFHLHVGKMTVTLDDVVCLVQIPIEGKIPSHDKKVFQEIGVALMTELVGFSEVVTIKECVKKYFEQV